jgi:GNAT superfamily N-acetyltransferase
VPVSTYRKPSRPDAVRIEEAGLNALHTLRQLFYDGWLLRVSPGAAKRARSVNPHFGSTLPTAAKIDYCEQVYARHGLPTLFRMTPFAKPADLGATLAARGYEAFGETFVQTLSLDRPPELPDRAGEAMVESADLAAFAGAVGSLRGSTPIQRDGHLERLANSPLQMRHAVVRVDGRIVCTGQVAIEGEIVGLFDVITAPDARGRGYATLACASLLAWAWEHGANTAYLQVSADNAPAIGVYRRLGFATLYTYDYRAREGERE